MIEPRKRKMLLVAVTAVAGAGTAAACSSTPHIAGFYGDIAYDGGYDDAQELGDAQPAVDGGTDALSERDAAAEDARDASDDGG